MIPIPAIDLKDGNVVRLLHGDFKEQKIYEIKAETVARRYEEDGAQRIHVVDLDGALKGVPTNLNLVEKILKSVRVPVEVGGGIRDLKSAARYFDMGARWVILGTKACLDRGFMEEAVQEFKDRIIIGVDALDGMVATDGWTRVTKMKAVDLAKAFEDFGGQTVIYTDISKDGALKGPNFKEIKTMCDSLRIKVIASGGVGSLEDVRRLIGLKKANLEGVIIGKALYEKKLDLRDAVKSCLQNA